MVGEETAAVEQAQAPAAADQGAQAAEQSAGTQEAGQEVNAAQQAVDQASQAQQQAQEGQGWYSGLPETAHETLKQFDSLDHAVEALKSAREFATVKGVEDYTFSFTDGTTQDNPGVVAFKDFCFKNKISPEAGQKLLDFETGLRAKAYEQMKAANVASLQKEWGANYEGNLKAAAGIIAAIDKAAGTDLASSLKANGGANDPQVAKALLWLSKTLSEDSLGAGGPGANPNIPIREAAEAYEGMFKE